MGDTTFNAPNAAARVAWRTPCSCVRSGIGERWCAAAPCMHMPALLEAPHATCAPACIQDGVDMGVQPWGVVMHCGCVGVGGVGVWWVCGACGGGGRRGPLKVRGRSMELGAEKEG